MHDTSSWINFFNGFNIYSNSIRLKHFFDYVLETFPLEAERKITCIELGAGSGATAKILANIGFQVTATDIDKAVIDRLNHYCGNDHNLSVKYCDIFECPKTLGSYDFLYHQGLLEHFTKQQIIETLNHQRKLSKNLIIDVPNNRDYEKHYGDESFYSYKEWKEMFKRAGLKIICCKGRLLPAWCHILPFHFHKQNNFFGRVLNRAFGKAFIFHLKHLD